MINQQTLDYLTHGYKSVAQMSINLAYDLGYIANPNYILIAPFGDDASAGLPFIIEPIPTQDYHFEFLAYDADTIHLVPPEYQVLVYRESEYQELTPKQQYKMLCQFANQFHETSFIGKFLTPALLHWLSENSNNPNIHSELLLMKNVAKRLESHLNELEQLIR